MKVPMDDFHPTTDGTKAIIHAIHDDLQIVVNEKFITADRLYQGVEGVFRYGCLRCPAYLGLNHQSLCPKCLPAPVTVDNPAPVVDVDMDAAQLKRGPRDDREDISGTPCKKISRRVNYQRH